MAGRALAALLSVPLAGGPGLGSAIDALIYPHGACCCLRAQGRPHHCHCAPPTDNPGSAGARRLACRSQIEEGGPEYGPPELQVLPPVLTAGLDRSAWSFTLLRRRPDLRILVSRIPAPPPTPPPDFATA